MEIILLQDVDKLGKKGDVAHVAEGYARNFLLPRKLAEIATPVAHRRRQAGHGRPSGGGPARSSSGPTRPGRCLSKTVVTITAPVGTSDRLFGSVTNQDIADAIFQARKIRIDKHNVDLEEPIKTVGTYMVKVQVHSSVEPAEVKVIVAPEEEKA